ncbi:MAG TPA: type II CAAX endopeptidase family protein [Vicinamibacterales bacterium]|nr:type II CAAX endopeptidase family protein [Vicinamibacterales bacterium]
MTRLFVGSQGVRGGWRFLLFLVLAIGGGGLFQLFLVTVVGYRPPPGFGAFDLGLADGSGLFVALLVAALLNPLDRHPFGEYGLPVHGRGVPRFVEGIAWGATGVCLLVGLIWMGGGVSFGGLALHGAPLAHAALTWAVTMIVLGLYEEFLFRGYPLVALWDSLGFWPAAILLSVLFGALHYFTKPMETWVDFSTVGLLGLFLAYTFFRTGSLWFAVGFHAAFDYAALVVFGGPNSGNGGKPLDDRLLATTFHGPAWLTGGSLGPEASLFAFLIVAGLFAAFAWRSRGLTAMRD